MHKNENRQHFAYHNVYTVLINAFHSISHKSGSPFLADIVFLPTVVRRVAKRFGLRPVGEGEEWTVFWIDTSVILDRVMNMKRYQVRPCTVHTRSSTSDERCIKINMIKSFHLSFILDHTIMS